MGKVILVFARVIAGVFSVLPRRGQLCAGRCLGFILRQFKFRSPIVWQNLKLAYPGQDALQSRYFKASYEHLGHLFFELLMVLGPLKSFVAKTVDFEGGDVLTQALQAGKGVVFLSSHVGNWEVMAATSGVFTESDLVLVTKRVKPAWLHEAIEEGRKLFRVRATYEPQTLREVLKTLKRGQCVGMVLDQYSGPPVGIRVPLFGIPVGTSGALAAIVKRTGAAVLPVENFRKQDGRWQVTIHSPLVWKKLPSAGGSELHEELALNTAHYVSVLEKHILAHPDQWLWLHRRFKGDLSPLRQGEWGEIRVRH